MKEILFAHEFGSTLTVPCETKIIVWAVLSGFHTIFAIAQARSKKKQRELIGQLLRVIACDQVPDRLAAANLEP